jgi:serine/threonine-protein kinase
VNSEQTTLCPQKFGKYEIRREVGRGGMGVVYEAYDPVICRRVALKTLSSDLLSGPEADTHIGRLRREAQAAGRLTHPNIVAVYDFGEEPRRPAGGAGRIAYISMEFVEGRELGDLLARQERLPIPTIVRIMGQLLDALEYSHKNGVVHRDIKPSNIILLEGDTVKVTDFGIARIESSTLTQAGTVMGSPSYMAPEQLLAQPIDGRSDLYSAGVLLYELLAGDVPFPGSLSTVMHKVLNDTPTPVSALNLHAPRGADALLGRALAKRPADRFQSAAEFKQAIISTLTAGNAGGTRGNRKTWATIAACAIAAVAGAGYLVRNSNRGPEPLTKSEHPAHGTKGGGSTTGTTSGGTTAGTTGSNTTAGTPNPARGTEDGGATGGVQATAAVPSPEDVPSQTLPRASGTAVITAVGLADPQDPRFVKQGLQVEPQLWGDARRQLIEKAVALYIDPSSINAHYALLRDKLFSRSDQYISSVLEQVPPQLRRYGLLLGTLRATVRVHDVQRSLNAISREDHVEFIRNNGNPRIAVEVRVGSERSAVAENILMERIRSFGFVTVDAATAQPAPDFLLSGEVSLKHLSATLPASGLTIEKVALTSWTLRTLDSKTGEEIYLNTTIPQKQSWASEELALQQIGQLIGSKFSREFFLQYFDFGTQRVRLRFQGFPGIASQSLVAEATAALRILNASLAGSATQDVVIDIDVGGGSDAAGELVSDALLNPLNRKMGQVCFAAKSGSATELLIDFDPVCASPAVLARLDALPPGALIDAPSSRIEEIFSDPARLRRAAL